MLSNRMKRTRWITLAIAGAVAACGTSSSSSGSAPPGAVLLDGFYCGGFAGYSCPPDSTCPDCSDPDCGSQCYATRACDPAAASACPSGFACDPAKRYCLPAKTCGKKSDCDPGMFCVQRDLSKGICVTIPALDQTACGTDVACTFPYACTGNPDSKCRLPCIDGECPTGMKCGDNNVCLLVK